LAPSFQSQTIKTGENAQFKSMSKYFLIFYGVFGYSQTSASFSLVSVILPLNGIIIVQYSKSISIFQRSKSFSIVQCSKSISIVQSSKSISIVQRSNSISIFQHSMSISIV